MSDFLKNGLTLVVATLVALAMAEGGLALLGYGSLYQSGVSRIHDPHLLYRLEPGFAPDIDDNGYRNPSTEGPFDVVLLGDSHTYGYGVTYADGLPGQLAAMSGLRSYNFGMGGYGPAQYAYLTDRALALRPRFLVIPVFLGNDVTDACAIANLLPYWRDHFAEHGLTTEHCGGAFEPRQEPDAGIWGRTKALIKSTRLGSVVNQAVVLPLKEWLAVKFTANDPDHVLILDDGKVRSLFTPWQNASPGGQDGLGIAKHFLARSIDAARAVGVCPVVVLLPSKQNLLFDYARSHAERLPNGYVEAVEAERRFEVELRAAAEQAGALVGDATGELLKAFDTPGPLYPADFDSHPTAKGYAAYARAVLPLLDKGCAGRDD